MSKVLGELLGLLKLELLDDNLFLGQSQDLGFHSVFGGQVIGQALSAAKQTLTDDRQLHSFHSYFLRPGDAKKPITYLVEVTRDGRSFSTRRVQAMQNGKECNRLNGHEGHEGERGENSHNLAMPTRGVVLDADIERSLVPRHRWRDGLERFCMRVEAQLVR